MSALLSLCSTGDGFRTEDNLADETKVFNKESDAPLLRVKVKRLPHACFCLPEYETEESAALDLRAAIGDEERVSLDPGIVKLIPTGLCIAIPKGYAGLVLPRSGLSCKQRIQIVNSPGLVDPDFRGELMMAMINLGRHPFAISRGQRLAQLLVVPAPTLTWHPVSELETTDRGTSGWGSTGNS